MDTITSRSFSPLPSVIAAPMARAAETSPAPPQDSVDLSSQGAGFLASGSPYDSDSEYDSKKSATRNGVTTTDYYGGQNGHVHTFQEVKNSDMTQRTRYNHVSGEIEGTYRLDKHTGTETIHLNGGNTMSRTADGRYSGHDSDGNALDPSDAEFDWGTERANYDLPQQKARMN